MRGFELLFQINSKTRRRLVSNVFISILHSIRSKIDKNELQRIGKQAIGQKKFMSSSMFAGLFDALKKRVLFDSFQILESNVQEEKLREKAYTIMERLFLKRLGQSLLEIKKASHDSLAEKAGYCEGSVVLFRFFYRRAIQEKSCFFHAGKELFEDYKKNIPSSAKKAQLIKSPSLVFEISQNFKIAYQILGLLTRKKISDSFR